MTKFQALFVAFLRHDDYCNGSYRWVAAKYKRRYSEKLPFNYKITNGGNQIDGMELSLEASKKLNIILD